MTRTVIATLNALTRPLRRPAGNGVNPYALPPAWTPEGAQMTREVLDELRWQVRLLSALLIATLMLLAGTVWVLYDLVRLYHGAGR